MARRARFSHEKVSKKYKIILQKQLERQDSFAKNLAPRARFLYCKFGTMDKILLWNIGSNGKILLRHIWHELQDSLTKRLAQWARFFYNKFGTRGNFFHQAEPIIKNGRQNDVKSFKSIFNQFSFQIELKD